MGDQSIQEQPPCPRKYGSNQRKKNSTISGTYRKLARSLPSSRSAHDFRLFDMCSSSRGVIADWDEGLNCESESTKTNSKDAPSNQPRPSSWQRFFKLWKKSSIKRPPSFPPIIMPKISRRKSRSAKENAEIDNYVMSCTWKTFSLADLQMATNNFSKENLIGKGGYSEVYKGCLPDGQLVAIKRLNKEIEEEHLLSFLCEIGIIAHVNHPNTAKMIGYGVEGGAYLVLQLSSLGSLGSLLHSSKEKLDWSKRYKIILGIAEGLLYLHENCQRRIIHRDIKADNILLSKDFEPQICDFGLSKWLPQHWSHHNATKFEGTFGYFAPEYFMHGIVDEKTDIFSFGVLLLEVITGRQALDESRKSLVLWAKPLLDNHAITELVDPFLRKNYDAEEMGWVVSTASMCIERNPVLRPRMSQVITLLKGSNERTCLNGSRQKQLLQRTYSEELSYVEEYNSTKYLIDFCNKHEKFELSS